MTEEIAINVNSITKTYKLYESKYDFVKEAFHPLRKKYHRKFNALRDISFKVNKGDVLGIIGKNGSGKSTLQKILASVVTPTNGDYYCNGKVTALLELGGGFDPVLTGIQNIEFLTSLQGYPKKVIEKRKKGIIDFADIGDYIDQPVKTYSSGMYMRLAFSIAINVDPDILIIDEVLGVGDMRFQQKCFRKLNEFKENGKTIVLCTHNVNVVKTFCSKAIWIHNGELKEQGDPVRVTDYYNAMMTSDISQDLHKNGSQDDSRQITTTKLSKLPPQFQDINWTSLSKYESFGTGDDYIQYAAIINKGTGGNVEVVEKGDSIEVLLFINQEAKIKNPVFQLLLNDRFGTNILNIFSSAYNRELFIGDKKSSIVKFSFEFPKIGNGRFSFSFGLLSQHNDTKQYIHWIHDALVIEVLNKDIKYKTKALLILEDVDVNSYPI